MEYTHIKHGFEPVYDKHSVILILGTLPSVKSRENNFYYGHRQNRFWRVLSEVYGCPLPQSTDEKKAMLLANRTALWDVIAECDIKGSSDSSIKNVVPADIKKLIKTTEIRAVFANGGTAKRLYDRYQKDACGMDINLLPSTSPANAAWTMSRLVEAWSLIKRERDEYET